MSQISKLGYLSIALMSAATVGCKSLPNPFYDSHGTWMNATTLSMTPPKSAACPRTPLPYCADPMFHGYHRTCWTPWPAGWENNCYPCPGGFEEFHEIVVEPGEPTPPPEIVAPLPTPIPGISQ
ncbi:hypothetical protein [Blastopirellula marina]|nr:hypothetical protein [Blastopirellula marina]